MSKKKTSSKGNFVIGFFNEVKEEARQVTWPTKQEATHMTLIVIGVCIAAGVYLGGLDYLFTKLMGLILS